MSHESLTTHKLRCDVCRTATLARDGASVRELRQRAKAVGWRYVPAGRGHRGEPHRDLCERCAGGAA